MDSRHTVIRRLVTVAFAAVLAPGTVGSASAAPLVLPPIRVLVVNSSDQSVPTLQHGTTVVSSHAVVTLNAGHQFEQLPPFDVSGCGTIRINSHGNSNAYSVRVEAVDPVDNTTLTSLTTLNQNGLNGDNTEVLDVPGTAIQLRPYLWSISTFDTTVTMSVLCRP